MNRTIIVLMRMKSSLLLGAVLYLAVSSLPIPVQVLSVDLHSLTIWDQRLQSIHLSLLLLLPSVCSV